MRFNQAYTCMVPNWVGFYQGEQVKLLKTQHSQHANTDTWETDTNT